MLTWPLLSTEAAQTAYQNLGSTARSYQGFDKDGLILFEHTNYAGNGVNYRESDADITSSFPSGVPGVSSFLVYRGVWELYIGVNFTGGLVNINGKSSFGPGTKISSLYHDEPSVNDQIKSVKKIQD